MYDTPSSSLSFTSFRLSLVFVTVILYYYNSSTVWRIARPQQFDEDNSTVRVGTQWRIFHIHNIILLLPGDGWTDAIPKTTSHWCVPQVQYRSLSSTFHSGEISSWRMESLAAERPEYVRASWITSWPQGDAAALRKLSLL